MTRKDHSFEASRRNWPIAGYRGKKPSMPRDSKEAIGVLVSSLPTLSGTDSWHHKRGHISPKSRK